MLTLAFFRHLRYLIFVWRKNEDGLLLKPATVNNGEQHMKYGTSGRRS
jgi:hypothetical protein